MVYILMVFSDIVNIIFVICIVVFCVIVIALNNITRDLKKTKALLINSYPIMSKKGYKITRIYEYSINAMKYISKITSKKEYDKETAYSLSGEKIGEFVDIYYERMNHSNIHENNSIL